MLPASPAEFACQDVQQSQGEHDEEEATYECHRFQKETGPGLGEVVLLEVEVHYQVLEQNDAQGFYPRYFVVSLGFCVHNRPHSDKGHDDHGDAQGAPPPLVLQGKFFPQHEAQFPTEVQEPCQEVEAVGQKPQQYTPKGIVEEQSIVVAIHNGSDLGHELLSNTLDQGTAMVSGQPEADQDAADHHLGEEIQDRQFHGGQDE